jgi:hypothetical protein
VEGVFHRKNGVFHRPVENFPLDFKGRFKRVGAKSILGSQLLWQW